MGSRASKSMRGERVRMAVRCGRKHPAIIIVVVVVVITPKSSSPSSKCGWRTSRLKNERRGGARRVCATCCKRGGTRGERAAHSTHGRGPARRQRVWSLPSACARTKHTKQAKRKARARGAARLQKKKRVRLNARKRGEHTKYNGASARWEPEREKREKEGGAVAASKRHSRQA